MIWMSDITYYRVVVEKITVSTYKGGREKREKRE